MGVKIIIDSTFDISENLKDKVITVPLNVHFGDEEYIDGVTITNKEFYEKLLVSKVMPKTSLASPDRFVKAYEEATSDGDCAIVITISSKLSGTHQSAVIAAQGFEDKVFVVDSKNVTIGAGALAEYALKLAEDGMEAKEIADELNKQSERIRIVAVVDTLEYLMRGGRVSKTAAIAGGILNIKPVIAVKDGEILTLGKARGTKMGGKMMNTEVEKYGGIDFNMPVVFGYTGLSDKMLKDYLNVNKESYQALGEDLNGVMIGSVVGTHAGPDAYAVAFFANM